VRNTHLISVDASNSATTDTGGSVADANALEIGEIAATLAMDAINVQLRFNQAHETALKEFDALVAAIDPSIRQLLAPLIPSRMELDNFELGLGVTLTREIEGTASIRATPIGLCFSILHAVRTDRCNRLSVSVKQHPMPQLVQLPLSE
jgi:hypothetical protein